MDVQDLIVVEDLSPRKISQKRSEREFLTVPKDKKEEYELLGWEETPSKLKKSIRVVRLKKHSIAFEDRVWALLAKMEFEYINRDDKFKLNYGDGLEKQIDVFAFDPETILIIECKSTNKRRWMSYQKDINELVGIKDSLRESAWSITGDKRKVAFIFCTNNAVLSKNDKTRLEQSSIFHFTQDTIDYYEQLTDHLGIAAKYQLYGYLFEGQSIPKLKNKIPAVKGKVSSGQTIYSFCIEPEYLLKIGYILHRTDTNPATTYAYQRLVKKSRLREIAKYIDKGGYFPNSIIVNIRTRGRKKLRFNESEKIPHDSDTSLGILHLPKTYRSAFIIDGQHRLYGYSKATSDSNHTIPVVAFHNLPAEEQARIFIDINRTQRSVPANLLQSIMAEFHWGSINDRQALSALKTRLLTELTYEDDSPFYKRIITAEERKTEKRCLTINTLKTWGLNRVKYFGQLKGDKLIQIGYLQGDEHEATLKKSKQFIKQCFGYLEMELPHQWEIGSGDGGFISMNIGVSAIIRILDDILDYIVINEKVKPFDLNGDQLGDKTLKYLDPVIAYLDSLDPDGVKQLRGLFGSGATEKVQREFQNAIHLDFPNFKPEGLEEWIEASSGKFTLPAFELGTTKIEPMIHGFIIEKLKSELGKKNWWREGVPKKVQKECSNRKIDEGSHEPEESFLTTIHYESIISDNWILLGEYFSPPGSGNIAKSKKLSWINEFNNIRKKYSHPQRENISEKELSFLVELDEWLTTNLS